jgi:hypothetical protein
MDAFLEALTSRRLENSRAKTFFPHGSIDTIVTLDCIKAILRELHICELQLVEELATNIRRNKTIVFPILTSIRRTEHILDFVYTDQYADEPAHADHKLPLSLPSLEHILQPPLSNVVAREFFDKQWEFVAPVFLRNALARRLERYTVLPFLAEEVLDKGGFGVVHKVSIHGAHQNFSEGPVTEWKVWFPTHMCYDSYTGVIFVA